jgi:hypothetical protein
LAGLRIGLARTAEIAALAVLGAIAATYRIQRMATAAESDADARAQGQNRTQYQGFDVHLHFLMTFV